MPSYATTTRLLRLSTVTLFLMTVLVLISPVMDWMNTVQTMLGRINNLSMFAVFVFFALSLFLPPMLRSPKERSLLLASGAFLLYATIITHIKQENWLVSYGGLTILYGAVSAGFGAYALAKYGKGLQTRIVIATILTLPALAMAPIFIAMDPGAYKPFWLHVYGYSNVRVFGYFAAAVTVILSGLALGSLKKNLLPQAVAHFAALSFAWSMLFWGGSRAGMVAVIASIVLCWIISWRKSWVQIPFTIGASIAGLGLSALYYTPDNAFGAINRVQVTVNSMASGGASQASSGRLEMWQWAWGKVLEHPFVGHGYLPMSNLRTDAFNYYHTHNIVIEYMLSFGIIAGGLALLLGIGLWVRALLAARRIDTPVATALMMIVTVLPIYAMFSATLFFPFHMVIFMLSLGSLIGWDMHLRQPEEIEEPFKAEADWMFEDL